MQGTTDIQINLKLFPRSHRFSLEKKAHSGRLTREGDENNQTGIRRGLNN